MAERTLSREEARAFYDRFGKKQDDQGLYEDPATRRLEAAAAFERARFVVEFGCGTGRVAEGLLKRKLPPAAHYLGLDQSATMIALASERLSMWSDRAEVRQTDGSPSLTVGDRSCDRVLSTYVLDLLSPEDIEAFEREAHRALAPGGRLCLAGLTFGERLLPRLVSTLWSTVHRVAPSKVGGCRPLHMADRLPAERWSVMHREVVATWGISSEVLVAVPR